ncbi:MAG TPA: (2Fe-2S)-binding protein, partial [Clostridia bacterium]|nr:(2Fe-2S)-binding protein [Clostridia bacterium]
KNADPDLEDIKKSISGNLCRCTGYQKIVQAIKIAAQAQKEQKEGGETA